MSRKEWIHTARTLATVALGLAAAFAVCGRFSHANAEGQSTQKAGGTSPDHVYLDWPLPATGKAYGEIDGRHLWSYVKEQADISRRYRDNGHPQYWGRISGTSGDAESAEWLLGKYRRIGLVDVRKQTVAFLGPQWAPESWEVTATLDGQTVQLASAQPSYGAVSTDGKVRDLPLVYVGLGSEADFAGRNVRGKAVLFVRGEISYQIGPGEVLKRAADRGAAAIIGTDLRGGNYKATAYRTDVTVPTFNVGTEDGLMLRDMIVKAPANNPPRVKIRLDAKWVSGQKSFLVWGTLPGATDETIYVIAHRDGWFDGAGDNASGVAVMLGLAEHFAKIPPSQRRRTIIFAGTDGHHQTPGSYGRYWMYENRAKLFSKTALMLNCEHPSEVLTHTHNGITGRTDTINPMWWYAGGPSRPQLTKVALSAFREFGVPVWSEERRVSGDMRPFHRILPGVVVQSSYYTHMHTDGDSPDIVAWSGLEAVTRAYARIVDEVNKLPLSDLQRPPESPSFNTGLAECTAWIKDSSVATCRRKD